MMQQQAGVLRGRRTICSHVFASIMHQDVFRDLEHLALMYILTSAC